MHKNNKGFSLVEVIIVAAIISFLSLAIAALMTNMQKSVNRVDAKQSINTLKSNIQATISSKEMCEKLFNIEGAKKLNINFSKANKSDPSLGMPLELKINNGIMKAGNKLNGTSLLTRFITLGDAKLAGQDSAGLDVYKFKLNGSFMATKDSIGGEYFKNQNFGSILAKVNSASEMLTCFNFNPNDAASLDDLADLMCTKFGGTYDSQASKCEGIAPDCDLGDVHHYTKPGQNCSRSCTANREWSTETCHYDH